jgi:hypothetical protein
MLRRRDDDVRMIADRRRDHVELRRRPPHDRDIDLEM